MSLINGAKTTSLVIGKLRMKAVVGMQLERDNVDAPEDDRLVVKWLENHPKSTQKT